LPNVPTLAELHLPGFEAAAWWGVFAPAKTPPEIIGRVYKELSIIFNDPQNKEKLAAQGMNLKLAPPEQLGKFLDDQIVQWSKVIKEHNIRAGD
jgi:tripartite-type tricarboxylate transporter receptor subunit TctC